MSIGPLSAATTRTANYPTRASGPTRAARRSGDPAAEATWQTLDRLTAGDRAMIEAATGRNLPTRDGADRPLIPILAAQISADRQTGRLGVGQAVDAGYLTRLADQYETGFNPFGDELDKAMQYLIADTASSTVDTRA